MTITKNFVEKTRLKKNLKNWGTSKKKIAHLGDVCFLTITAIGLKNVGIDEFYYLHPVFVPNAKLGEKIQCKIIKIAKGSIVGQSPTINPLQKKVTYAIAKKTNVNTNLGKEKILKGGSPSPTLTSCKPGDLINASIKKLTSKGAGVVEITKDFKVIVPNGQKGENLKIKITRAKQNYGFGKILKSASQEMTLKKNSNLRGSFGEPLWCPGGAPERPQISATISKKLTLCLPKKAKIIGNYILFKINGFIIFVKMGLGAKIGDKVRIKFLKINTKFAFGKIIKINPTTAVNKREFILNNIVQMLKNGLHFGEKAVKCHAKMKKFVWQKKGLRITRPILKKGRHIINVLKTRRCLNKALTQVSKYAAKGKTFFFIGTKKPAAGLIARASLLSKKSFFVNTRWLGGLLTNWKTICKSISKIKPILKEKQKIVLEILEKRQNIKFRLIKKALLIRKKSQLILNKGRLLVEQVKNKKIKTELFEKAKILLQKKQSLIVQSKMLIEKKSTLFVKQKEIMIQSKILKKNGQKFLSNYKNLFLKLTEKKKKLLDLKSLLVLIQEIKNFKQNLKEKKKTLFSVSYNFLKELNKTDSKNLKTWVVPNPPKNILNKIVVLLKKTYTSNLKNPKITKENQILTEKLSTLDGKLRGWGPLPTSNLPTLEKKIVKKTNISASPLQEEQNTNTKIILLNKLICRFCRFESSIKILIKTLFTKITELVQLCKVQFSIVKKIQQNYMFYNNLKKTIIFECKTIQNQLKSKINLLQLIKKKSKSLITKKRLLKFLPCLRYLPTPQKKINATIQILMKKIVDPKLKFPIDNLYDEKLSGNSKKIAGARKKKWLRLEKYFGGVANMVKMNQTKIQKNIGIVIGQKEEINAIRECKKLGIKMFNIVDTNCDPTLSDHIIPANDDSRNSIKYVLNKFLIHIRLAQKLQIRLKQRIKKKQKLS